MFNQTHDELRRRFHANRAERETILAKSGPLRANRDELSQRTDKKLREMAEEIKEVEAGLYELDCEAGKIARALGGKTGNGKA